MYAEETRDVLIEVQLMKPLRDEHHAMELTEPKHIDVTLTYIDTVKKVQVDSDPVECFIGRPMGSEVSDPDPYVTKQWLRLCAVKEMKAAQSLAKLGNIGAARSKIESWEYLVEKECNNNKELRKDGLTNQLKRDMGKILHGMCSPKAFEDGSTVMMMDNFSNQHLGQRSSSSVVDIPNVYRSKRKAEMAVLLTPKSARTV